MEEYLKDPEAVKGIMDEIRKNKIEAADKWKEVQKQLASDIVKEQERILNEEKESTVNSYYDEQLIDIFNQFESLQNSNPRELQAYIQANPGRKEIFDEMVEKAKQYHGKRKTPPAKPKIPPTTFENEISELLQQLSESVDISELTVFADRAFMYKGEIYTQGTKILFTTRAGQDLPASIYNITEFELTVVFDDKGYLTIKADDVISGKVQIKPQPPKQV